MPTYRTHTSRRDYGASDRFERGLHAATRVVFRLAYRYRATGLEHVPTAGGALLVANHVTFVDAFILAAGLRRTPRFVMHAYWACKIPGLSWLAERVGIIPIASRREDPETFARAFEQIAADLEAGELVVLFPEGTLTRDGELLEFRRGVEHVVRRTPVPVVPVALRGLWGSRFSRATRSLRGTSLRRRRVEVVVGSPVEPSSVTAAGLRAQVAELLAA